MNNLLKGRSKMEVYAFAAVVAVAAYLIYKATKAVGTAAVNAYNGAVDSTSDAISNIADAVGIGPGDHWSGADLIVTFVEPGAPRHAIPAEQVAADGTFNYGGKRYQLRNNQQGQHFGVPIQDTGVIATIGGWLSNLTGVDYTP